MDQELKIWYVLIDGQKSGPFCAGELLKEKPLTPEEFTKDSLVWKSGMISWLRAADVSEFAALHPNYVEEESAETPISASQDSVFAESGEESAEISKSYKLDSIVNELKNNFKELKNDFENLRRSNPLAVIAGAAAAGLIFIFLTTYFICGYVDNRREDKKLALEIERIEREFKERQERKEQAFRDSVERVELDRLREIRLELQKQAALDSIARIRAGRKFAAAPPRPLSFTDPSDGNTYTIKKIGNTTWFLDDLQNGRGFTWQQASALCPKGWRLPSDREWRSLASVLKNEAGSHFAPNRYWWSAAGDGADSWYISGGNLVYYSGSDNRSAINRVRCIKE